MYTNSDNCSDSGLSLIREDIDQQQEEQIDSLPPVTEEVDDLTVVDEDDIVEESNLTEETSLPIPSIVDD